MSTFRFGRQTAGLVKLTACALMLMFCIVFGLVTGCSNGSPEPANSPGETGGEQSESADGSSSAPATPSVDARSNAEKIVGVWLGAAYFDEAALEARLQRLPEERREGIVQQARYFGATIMAFSFEADGTMENEVEVLPEGGLPGREAGVGTWKIISEQESGFIVELVEQSTDGSVSSSRKVYKFYEDGDHFAMQVPLDGILGECNPLILFERQILDENGFAITAPENVADAAATELK